MLYLLFLRVCNVLRLNNLFFLGDSSPFYFFKHEEKNMANINFKIVGISVDDSKKVLGNNIPSKDLIAFLTKQKNNMEANFKQISVERLKDTLKVTRNVKGDWISAFADTFKLNRKNTTNTTTCSYVVRCNIYKEKTIPVVSMDFSQDTVLNCDDEFKDFVFDKMFELQSGMRATVLHVVCVKTDKENTDTETKIYSHVFYPESYVVPDLTGTGVKLRGNTDKKERCTPVRFNRKIRMDVGNQKIRFGNMPEVINGINRVIEEIAKYNRRQQKWKTK